MATSNGPNLATAKTAVERLMDDTCTIIRPATTGEMLLSQETGELAASLGNPRIVIYEGICKVKLKSSNRFTMGDSDEAKRRYEGSIVLEADPIQVGDLWEHTSARRDDQLVGRTFKVVEIVLSSFAISRKVTLEELV